MFSAVHVTSAPSPLEHGSAATPLVGYPCTLGKPSLCISMRNQSVPQQKLRILGWERLQSCLHSSRFWSIGLHIFTSGCLSCEVYTSFPKCPNSRDEQSKPVSLLDSPAQHYKLSAHVSLLADSPKSTDCALLCAIRMPREESMPTEGMNARGAQINFAK